MAEQQNLSIFPSGTVPHCQYIVPHFQQRQLKLTHLRYNYCYDSLQPYA